MYQPSGAFYMVYNYRNMIHNKGYIHEYIEIFFLAPNFVYIHGINHAFREHALGAKAPREAAKKLL